MNIASMLLRILAILGAIAAAVMFFIIGNTKDELARDLEDTQTRLQKSQSNLSAAENERQKLQEQAAALETQAQEAQAQASSLQNQLTRVRQELAQATQIIGTREEEAQSLQTEAARIRRELLDERNRVAELQQNLEGQDPEGTQASVRELERKLLETERRLLDLSRVDEGQGAQQQEQMEETRQALRGEVTEVGPDSAFVLINLGSAAGVRQDSPVMIRRGTRYIARANITEVHDDVSVARVAPGASPIRAGDVAITLF